MPPTGRPRSFDCDEALEKAMNIFLSGDSSHYLPANK